MDSDIVKSFWLLGFEFWDLKLHVTVVFDRLITHPSWNLSVGCESVIYILKYEFY